MFTVTYDIVTEESAAEGETAEAGFIIENTPLRDAIKALFETHSCHCEGIQCIEANESPMRSPNSVTVFNGSNYLTGACESRSLHMPANLTASTRRRIARLVGAR